MPERSGFLKWFHRHKHNIGLIAVGHAAKRVEEYLFDWLIYGAVVYWTTHVWGVLWGSFIALAIMAPLSALACLLYIQFYDWAGKDLFGFEALKELREEEAHTGWFGRLFARLLRLGDIPAFIALSIWGDPFITTVYLRKREHAHRGLTRRDWKVFWSGVLFSNAYWTLRWTLLISIARSLLAYFGIGS